MTKCVFLKILPGYTLESELETGKNGFGEINLLVTSVDPVRNYGSQTRVVAAEMQKGIL